MEKRYLITTGDYNGIGPEIILKAASGGYLKNCVVLGSDEVFDFYENIFKTGTKWSYLEEDNADFTLIENVKTKVDIKPGECTPEAGLFSLKMLDMAIDLMKNGYSNHLITGPLSKKAVSYHEKKFIGHTEHLARAFNTHEYSMMLANETFRVVLVTTHVSIKKIPELITKKNVETAIKNANNFLKRINDKRGIAVCALNPHAGEDGLLGTEEIEIISPVIQEQTATGINVSGPFPADSLFKTVFTNPYGVYIAMYHDQGLGPLKMISKGSGVNITLGLPVFRISVDHGTAYDIAGKGVALAQSLISAIKIAKEYN